MLSNPNVKVNLGLNVLRKREDGFHDLCTLFVPYLGISDRLEIITGDEWSQISAQLFAKYGADRSELSANLVQGMSEDGKLMITIARKEGVDWDPLKDLTAKAYFLLSEDFDLPPVKIFLEKNSPVGAGLGGGSSDAAFALKMMNEMFSLKLSDEELVSYAARLGSDCAFFIYNRPMLGEGRGEILTDFPLPELLSQDSRYELQVVVPEGISVSTADAYRGIVPSVPENDLRTILSRPIYEWKDLLANDFEKTVFQKYPELSKIKDSLYDSGAVYASMSGSGSALFAIYHKN